MRVHYINVGQGDAILIELQRAAILIDAGGETVYDRDLSDNLISYLNKFFEKRTQLDRTIDIVIITHPHLDHTKRLVDVVNNFRVKTLIDGGSDFGSGISQLKEARKIVMANGGQYQPVKDDDVRKTEISAFSALRALDPDFGLRLLSGGRDCSDENNNSLVLLVGYKDRRFIFAGDAQTQSSDNCGSEISLLLERYGQVGWLRADVLKVAHHGSASGTSLEWIKAVQPSISIISAGGSGKEFRGPGPSHAWQFGHPRESAVRTLRSATSGQRPTKQVRVMKSPRIEEKMTMTRAVYCTCWDGNIIVTIDGKTLKVETSN